MTKEQSYLNEKMEYYKTLIPKDKYEHPGIYSITVNDEIVYVGKARNMMNRIATHMYYIQDANLGKETEGKRFKYEELRKAREMGYDIIFDVLYCSPQSIEADNKVIDDDIGPQEAEFIHSFMPKLNRQVPHRNDYHKYFNKNYEHLNLPKISCSDAADS